jgi:heptosyltransferase-1
VAIYGPTNPARNGPFGPGGTNSIIKVLRSTESRTSHARHRTPEEGLLQISAQQVIEAALALLKVAK